MSHRNLIWLGGLVLANLLVLAGIAQVWFGPGQEARLVREREQLNLPKEKPLRNKEMLETFNVVVAKDLFSPDRSSSEVSNAKSPGLEDAVLLGTVIVGDEKAVLIGQKGARGKQEVQVLRQGEQWRDFRLVEIGKNEVILQGKEGKRSLTFPRPKLGQ